MNGDPDRGEHLTAEVMAAYLTAPERVAGRRSIEAHLLVCDACRREVVLARRTLRRGSGRTWAMAGSAVVAAGLLAVLLVAPDRLDLPVGGREPILRDGAPASGEGVEQISIRTPLEGSVVEAGALVFSWGPVDDEAFYVLTVVDENGDIVWETRTLEASVPWPSDGASVSGRQLFWFVDALVGGDRSATTGVHGFSVR